MTGKKKKLIIIVILLSAGAIAFIILSKRVKTPGEEIIRINPRKGDLTIYISTTGSVLPRNRLEIKPTVNGRMEQILVVEGQYVKSGQVLAYMSSIERAALIDAARSQGAEALEYWEKTYKAIPLVAPISGTVIVRSVEPGQSVTTTSAVLVLSDILIVKADVDETDIGRIRKGQEAMLSLDAHPEVQVEGRVSHISYESKVINNVTMYEVEIIPLKVPEVFRSGMSADINVVESVRRDVLLIPFEAVLYENGKSLVLLEKIRGKEHVKTEVILGTMDESDIEVISGISMQDTMVIKRNNVLTTGTPDTKKNPFMPSRRPRR